VWNNRDLYVADYVKLYADTVFAAAQSVLGSFAWVDSSPSNGLLSVDPYVKLWSQASTPTAGDMHFYDYDMDCENTDLFPSSRFVSEFGFQSQPSFQTYSSVLNATDFFKDSEMMLYRQRHEGGNKQMED
jgi:beta-mannosidase